MKCGILVGELRGGWSRHPNPKAHFFCQEGGGITLAHKTRQDYLNTWAELVELAETLDELGDRNARWEMIMLRYEAASLGMIKLSPTQLGAMRDMLSVNLPKLRAVEQDQDGDQAINANEQIERQIEDEFGNPWEESDERPNGKTTVG